MIRFSCDYTEGAHPLILEKLLETNMVQTVGYSEDEFCKEAKDKIKTYCGRADAEVHFLVGGTQTNFTVISAALRPHQGVLAAVSGHINVHETGAVEAIGHKVLTVESTDGKIRAEQIEAAYEAHVSDESFEHIVQPKMVYVSNPTELGTLYTKSELQAISEVCKKRDYYLFLDGARLGYGLCADGNDLTLADITNLCDVFYIGGTKVGALFGEAVIITNPELKKDFRYIMKQNGGMLAKGRLLGIQFSTLFTDDLYFKIARHGIDMANKLRTELEKMGISFYVESKTNQLFPILPDVVLSQLSKEFDFSYQARVDETHSAIRFCTSWATKEENVDLLLKKLMELL
ncbi:MAG: low specificity L-threonine aldolase [Lachnospiraceae bacterium]